MVQVRMRQATYSAEHGRLAAGQLVDVEPEIQKRWAKIGLAADPDDRAAQAALGGSTDALQAEIERLQGELARAQAGQDTPAERPASGPYDAGEDPFAALHLNERQRTSLQRSGFATLEQVRSASDEELTELDGFGAASVAKLREHAEAGDEEDDGAITRGPGPR